jgi:anaerobic magnesium-protoporphyrin IX monomethyl ester cyclase
MFPPSLQPGIEAGRGEHRMVKNATARRRVQLIEPPFYRLFRDDFALTRYPLSLGYLAGAVIKHTGWDVQSYNADFTPRYNDLISLRYLTGPGFKRYLELLEDPAAAIWREVETAIREFNPEVVGITSKSQNYAAARNVARIAKQALPGVKVIIGGPHPSMVGAKVLADPEFDAVVVGEGEATLVEVLQAWEAGRDLAGVAGTIFRRLGEVVENPRREYIEDLDALDFPHQSAPLALKDYAQYPVSAYRNIFTIRGCPFDCAFCGSRRIWSRRVRYRSPASVVKEVQALQRLGVQGVRFDDDTFGVSRPHLKGLCEALATHCPGAQFECEMPVGLISPDSIALLKSAGCKEIHVGIESGSNEILKAMRKGITIEEALAACREIRRQGINLQAFFIAGFPPETEQTLAETAQAMLQVDGRIVFSIFTPYPGTDLFEYCRERGLVDDDFDVSLYNHMSPANSFCLNLPTERFRTAVEKMERLVDRKNRTYQLRQAVSLHKLQRIRAQGLRWALRRGRRILGDALSR